MKVQRAHMMTGETARGEVERALPGLLQEFGSDVSDVTHVWSGDSMNFSFRARRLSIKGRIDVTDSQVVIEVSLPILARPFEGRIRSATERKLKQIFPG